MTLFSSKVGLDESLVALVREHCLKLLGGEPIMLIIDVDETPTTASGKRLVTTSDVPVHLS